MCVVVCAPKGKEIYTSKKDLFSTYWNRGKKKSTIPLRAFRSIGATILNSEKKWRWAESIYLGHALREIREVHFGKESNKPFVEALPVFEKIVACHAEVTR